jgi:hypothetical protein
VSCCLRCPRPSDAPSALDLACERGMLQAATMLLEAGVHWDTRALRRAILSACYGWSNADVAPLSAFLVQCLTQLSSHSPDDDDSVPAGSILPAAAVAAPPPPPPPPLPSDGGVDRSMRRHWRAGVSWCLCNPIGCASANWVSAVALSLCCCGQGTRL